MNGSRLRPNFSRALLWSGALVVAATSLTYTALWLYFHDPLATTMSEDLGLPRERLLQSAVRLGFQLRYVAELRGVRVGRVDPDSAAEHAGLRTDDVIVAVDGRAGRLATPSPTPIRSPPYSATTYPLRYLWMRTEARARRGVCVGSGSSSGTPFTTRLGALSATW